MHQRAQHGGQVDTAVAFRLDSAVKPAAAPEPPVAIVDLGRTDYATGYRLQRAYHEWRKSGEVPDLLLLTEHEPVITSGQGADFRHVLVDLAELARLGIPTVRTERGGDVTYHGPGQIIAYPILDLRNYGRDVHQYVRLLEDSALRLLSTYGINAERRPGAPGVYVGADKIASIGIFVSRWVTLHGLAINLCPDPRHLELLTPCGLSGTRMTSVALLNGERPSYADACRRYVAAFGASFGRRPIGALGRALRVREHLGDERFEIG